MVFVSAILVGNGMEQDADERRQTLISAFIRENLRESAFSPKRYGRNEDQGQNRLEVHTE